MCCGLNRFCCIQKCRYAVLGAGFAGLSVAWHLLNVLSLILWIFGDVCLDQLI